MSGLETHYSAANIEARLLEAIRSAGLDPAEGISPADLGTLDHFHTGGPRASLDLLELARIEPSDRVLDLGAGLGGAARLIASTHGCHVDCVEPSADYCTGAALLNRLTGLDDLIEVHQAGALDLPFPDQHFDLVWMQNVGMNIADKAGLYSEIGRVLKPGGRYVFQEMIAGETPTSYFPLPWATDPADSSLVPADETLAQLAEAGFVTELFEDTSEAHLNPTGTPSAKPSEPSPLSLEVYVDDLSRKARNARRSLEEGQIRLVRGVFRHE